MIDPVWEKDRQLAVDARSVCGGWELAAWVLFSKVSFGRWIAAIDALDSAEAELTALRDYRDTLKSERNARQGSLEECQAERSNLKLELAALSKQLARAVSALDEALSRPDETAECSKCGQSWYAEQIYVGDLCPPCHHAIEQAAYDARKPHE